jgi:hypothetical protein
MILFITTAVKTSNPTEPLFLRILALKNSEFYFVLAFSDDFLDPLRCYGRRLASFLLDSKEQQLIFPHTFQVLNKYRGIIETI